MQELPPKKDVALFLLQRSSVFVHLDPRSDDVIVPAGFKREPRLVLQVGHNMAVPIPDLTVGEDGWSGTLSFRRVPFRCVVPWTSVFAMVGQDGQGVVWPEDVPPEIAQSAGAGAPGQAGPAGQPAPAAAPPKMALAPAPAPEAAKEARAAEDMTDDGKKPKAKAKRARKKTDKADKADGSLQASPTPTPTPRPTPTPAPVPRAEPSSPAAPAAPVPAFGGAKGSKPKRELPPYLRVIK